MLLRCHWKEWLEKWAELHEPIQPQSPALAAPFISVGLDSKTKNSSPVILLVGKATHGCWKMEYFSKMMNVALADRIEERRDATISFLRSCSKTNSSAFWRFYRTLQHQTGANVIWTNLAKIGAYFASGTESGKTCNPEGRLLRLQAELAQATMRAEIAFYKPDLIYLTTGTYALSEIVNGVFCEGEWKRWQSADHTLWHIEGSGEGCPVIRTGHPSSKSTMELTAWIRVAEEFLAIRTGKK